MDGTTGTATGMRARPATTSWVALVGPARVGWGEGRGGAQAITVAGRQWAAANGRGEGIGAGGGGVCVGGGTIARCNV